MQEKVMELIIATARDLGDEEEVLLEQDLTPDTVLYGDQGLLDSMGLVSLVIAVEQAIEDEFEISVGLADEKALSQAKSPYRTIGSLAEYAVDQMRTD
jgi:D-alanine--poly(phosphoribitol) ligase subunit 2